MKSENHFEENSPSIGNETPATTGANSLAPISIGTPQNRRHARNYEASRKRAWRSRLAPERRKQISRRQSARICKYLTDGYVRRIIVALEKIPLDAVTPAMIQEKRRAIAAKRVRRLIKTLTHNATR